MSEPSAVEQPEPEESNVESTKAKAPIGFAALVITGVIVTWLFAWPAYPDANFNDGSANAIEGIYCPAPVFRSFNDRIDGVQPHFNEACSQAAESRLGLAFLVLGIAVTIAIVRHNQGEDIFAHSRKWQIVVFIWVGAFIFMALLGYSQDKMSLHPKI